MHRIPVVAACLAVLLVACGGSDGPFTGPPVDVELRDFEIAVVATLPVGPTRLRLTNFGPTVHEVVIIASDASFDELPRTSDGQRLDEEAVTIIAADEFIDVASVDELHVVLRPGAYWLICNIEGHFLGGMTAQVDVP